MCVKKSCGETCQETVRDKSIRDIIGSIMLLVTNPLFARPDKWTNWF